eukprot:TRINITY_DN2050_c0_g2_i2.p1 TRINITY_DN2050_c0_g2~~TRINITY_DN2050_c0_g2_i2.p1  ORF type:complete len:242 (-),score=42.78 TRINITY_DN2050_c0_g2_i2:253-978(-)
MLLIGHLSEQNSRLFPAATHPPLEHSHLVYEQTSGKLSELHQFEAILSLVARYTYQCEQLSTPMLADANDDSFAISSSSSSPFKRWFIDPVLRRASIEDQHSRALNTSRMMRLMRVWGIGWLGYFAFRSYENQSVSLVKMAIEVGAMIQGVSFSIRFHNDWRSFSKKIDDLRNYHPSITTHVDEALTPAIKDNANTVLAAGESIYHFASVAKSAPTIPTTLGILAVGVLSGVWMRKFVFLR